MPYPSHRCSNPTQNRHDAFFELMGRTRHTLGREHETPRIVQRRDEYEGESERGQCRPSGDDPEGPGGRNSYTPRLPIYSQVTHILPGYMCVSGKSLNALVARDKTRSAQSSRSSSGDWRALLNYTAIDRMRWFQHNSQAIFGTTPGLTTGEKPGLGQ
jgi:hypothetical protein